jgi:raffinose/stachyose/melibiose transport system substrate-binding protein
MGDDPIIFYFLEEKMKQVKRILCIMVVLFLAAASAFARGGGQQSGGASTAANAQEGMSSIVGTGPIKLVYFQHTMDFDPATNIQVRWAREFVKTNPNISIEFQGSADLDEAMKKLTLMTATNTLPDMFFYTWNSARDYPAQGVVSDLTDRIKNDREWMGYFNPYALDNFTFNGRIYAAPVLTEAQGWFYNKAIFDKYNLKIPTTWDEFKNAIVVLKRNGVQPIAHGARDIWALWGYYAFFWRNGVADIIPGFNAKQAGVKWNSPNIVQVYAYIKELADLGAYPANVSTLNNTQAIEMFRAGNAAMFTTGTWEINGFLDPQKTPITNDIVFNWGPEFPNSKYDQKIGLKMVNWGTWVSKNLEKRPDAYEAALKFLKYCAGPEAARILVEDMNGFPATQHPANTRTAPLLKVMLDALGDNYAPRIEVSGAIPDPAFVEPFWNSITGVITGSYTPAQAAQSVDDWNAVR